MPVSNVAEPRSLAGAKTFPTGSLSSQYGRELQTYISLSSQVRRGENRRDMGISTHIQRF